MRIVGDPVRSRAGFSMPLITGRGTLYGVDPDASGGCGRGPSVGLG